jgi:hypothetical protein
MGRIDRGVRAGVGYQPSQSRRQIESLRSRAHLRRVNWLLGFRATVEISGVKLYWSLNHWDLRDEDVKRQTSFEPLPNPETTSPFMRSGKGGSGPESGPMIVARGPSGRIVFAAAGVLLDKMIELC